MNEHETELKRAARRALLSLDLTNLDEACDESAVKALAARAFTAHGHVAALCVWPRFVPLAHRLVGHRGVKIATVVNFPGGEDDAGAVADMTEQAVEEGADEIDLVIPYRAFLEGREESVRTRVRRVRQAAGPRAKLKAILETGVLETTDRIRRAGELALDGGAHFLKTSTGKVAVNATLRAARTMLETIRDAGGSAGFKAAGGVRTTQDAANYLDLADEVMGDGWATPETFRIGASGLLDALVETLEDRGAARRAQGY